MDQASTLARKLLAIAILAVVAWLLLKVAIGVVTSIAWVVAAVLAVIAVLWALRTL